MIVLLSRTDNIGDVIFTLPMAGLIKKFYPNSKVYFLGKSYTRAVVECSTFIDKFFDWDEIKKSQFPIEEFKKINADTIVHVFPNKEIARLACKANIKMRIGTNRRFFHFLTCNKLVNLTRKNSPLHESQLNLKLLNCLLIDSTLGLSEIPNYYGLTKVTKLLPTEGSGERTGTNTSSRGLTAGPILSSTKFNLILHPKSKGSAREWSAKHYVELCHLLPREKFNIFISGTKEEEKEIQEKILQHCPFVTSVVGAFTLAEFISFINKCDGLVACSTGPLHIAAALSKHALGLYPPIENMMPSRWGALGKYAQNLVGKNVALPSRKLCLVKCCNAKQICACINSVEAKEVANIIGGWV